MIYFVGDAGFGGFGNVPMYLQMIASITSSAPPPIDARRRSLI